jgi:hypothetical protein
MTIETIIKPGEVLFYDRELGARMAAVSGKRGHACTNACISYSIVYLVVVQREGNISGCILKPVHYIKEEAG